MRAILQSETYQRDSQPLPENKADERFYSRYYPRRLKAEVLLDAIAQVTGVPTDFKAATPDSRKPGRGDSERSSGRFSCPTAYVDSYFLERLRQARPADHLRVRAEQRAEHDAGAAPL